jgi:hypothetical protein
MRTTFTKGGGKAKERARKEAISTKATETECRETETQIGATTVLTQHQIKETVHRKGKGRVKTTLKEIENRKNLAAIAVSLDTQLGTVAEDKEKKTKNRTIVRVDQKR